LHKYKHVTVDNLLFLKISNSEKTTLLVYVDDVVFSESDISEINNITSLLDLTFKIKNLGDLTYFLGFEVTRTNKDVHLCQRKYTLDLLNEKGMLGCVLSLKTFSTILILIKDSFISQTANLTSHMSTSSSFFYIDTLNKPVIVMSNLTFNDSD